MTVRELIAHLKDCDQDANVMLDYGGTEMDVDGINEEDGYIVIQ
ncbi:hypothetical protein [Paenibacillus ferrarius]|nr:hypothetical protein [Paenibacillus ferrarius]